MADLGMELTPQNKDTYEEKMNEILPKKKQYALETLYKLSHHSLELVTELVRYELKQKAESKQLRNIDFTKIKPSTDKDEIKERLVSMAKD